jgi:hypothetical protein
MLDSETFGFAIGRPLSEVYEFLLEPTNFGRWAFVGDVAMRHLRARDWTVETSVGPRIIRFAERNAFGVLDHSVFRQEGDVPHPTGMWAIENGAGTELIYTNFRRDGMNDAEWASLKSWVVTDLLALQSLLETRGRLPVAHEAKVLSFGIDRPMPEVYDFLIRPRNFASWGFVGDAEMVAIADGEWQVETTVGPRILRFGQPNDAGILTYTSRLRPDTEPHPVPMRVMPNGEGTELMFVFYKRPQDSDEGWASTVEWVSADLLVLKSLLEAGSPGR